MSVYHPRENYNAYGRESMLPASSRGRSLSIARSDRARSKSRQPTDRSTITKASRSTRPSSVAPPLRARSKSRQPAAQASSSRGRSISIAPSSQPSSRVLSPQRRRSRSRARSKSRAHQRESGAPKEQANADADAPHRGPIRPITKHTSSKKFVVEIDEDTNEIIGVKEVFNDDQLESAGSGGSVQSNRNITQVRSRSILRSSRGSSFISQGDSRVAFDEENLLDTSGRSSYFEEGTSSGFAKEPNRRVQNSRGPRHKHGMNFKDVNFDPASNDACAHENNLVDILRPPDRPYEQQCYKPRNGTAPRSKHSEVKLSDNEQGDEDDFPGYSTRRVMEQYEEEEDVMLSDCESYDVQRDYARNHNRKEPLKYSSPPKANSFKHKLGPSPFRLQARRQTAPLCASRQSQNTDSTMMSTEDELDLMSPLFVDRAASSLMAYQKKHEGNVSSKKGPGKHKSRLARFLHR